MFIEKNPAHQGLLAKSFKWKKPLQEEFSMLQELQCFSNTFSLQKTIDDNSTKFVGFYKIKEKKTLFIKVFQESDCFVQNNAEKVSLWLSNHGINTIVSKKGYPKKINKYKMCLFVYDYLDGGFFLGYESSIFAIGNLLGKVHKNLQKYPSLDEVYSQGIKGNQILFEQFTKIKSGAINPDLPKNSIEILKKTSISEFNLLNYDAQMIHGDLNHGNIIYDKSNNEPFILDFENSTSTWLSPLYDLAYVVQRFILLRHYKEPERIAAKLFDGYKLQNNEFILHDPDLLFEITKMISVRCILIISTKTYANRKLFIREINKFVYLYNFTIENQSFYSKLSTRILKE